MIQAVIIWTSKKLDQALPGRCHEPRLIGDSSGVVYWKGNRYRQIPTSTDSRRVGISGGSLIHVGKCGPDVECVNAFMGYKPLQFRSMSSDGEVGFPRVQRLAPGVHRDPREWE